MDRGVMLVGVRGVGKTVLLNELRALAEARGWIVAKVEAGVDRPFRMLLSQSLNQALRSATGRHGLGKRLRQALQSFKSFTLKVAPDGSLALGIDVDPLQGRADTGDLELDLTELALDLAETARELGVGVVVLIDEMQDLKVEELSAVAAASHEAGQRSAPFVVVGAGLPSLPSALRAAKSYTERLFEYHDIGPLSEDAAVTALVRPAAARNVEWEEGARDLVLKMAAGYPYFIQVYGNTTWDYAKASPIDVDDATTGAEAGRAQLDTGFYGARWDESTLAQQAYLRAVAGGGDKPSRTADVAVRMGKTPQEVSGARDELIKKGLLYAPERGLIAFSAPGMGDYIQRRGD
jgi:AAA ATPase domain